MHREQGVTTRFGTGVTGIDRVADGLVVRLTDGSTVPAATVVVGIGAGEGGTPQPAAITTSLGHRKAAHVF